MESPRAATFFLGFQLPERHLQGLHNPQICDSSIESDHTFNEHNPFNKPSRTLFLIAETSVFLLFHS